MEKHFKIHQLYNAFFLTDKCQRFQKERYKDLEDYEREKRANLLFENLFGK